MHILQGFEGAQMKSFEIPAMQPIGSIQCSDSEAHYFWT